MAYTYMFKQMDAISLTPQSPNNFNQYVTSEEAASQLFDAYKCEDPMTKLWYPVRDCFEYWSMRASEFMVIKMLLSRQRFIRDAIMGRTDIKYREHSTIFPNFDDVTKYFRKKLKEERRNGDLGTWTDSKDWVLKDVRNAINLIEDIQAREDLMYWLRMLLRCHNCTDSMRFVWRSPHIPRDDQPWAQAIGSVPRVPQENIHFADPDYYQELWEVLPREYLTRKDQPLLARELKFKDIKIDRGTDNPSVEREVILRIDVCEAGWDTRNDPPKDQRQTFLRPLILPQKPTSGSLDIRMEVDNRMLGVATLQAARQGWDRIITSHDRFNKKMAICLGDVVVYNRASSATPDKKMTALWTFMDKIRKINFRTDLSDMFPLFSDARIPLLFPQIIDLCTVRVGSNENHYRLKLWSFAAESSRKIRERTAFQPYHLHLDVMITTESNGDDHWSVHKHMKHTIFVTNPTLEDWTSLIYREICGRGARSTSTVFNMQDITVFALKKHRQGERVGDGESMVPVWSGVHNTDFLFAPHELQTGTAKEFGYVCKKPGGAAPDVEMPMLLVVIMTTGSKNALETFTETVGQKLESMSAPSVPEFLQPMTVPSSVSFRFTTANNNDVDLLLPGHNPYPLASFAGQCKFAKDVVEQQSLQSLMVWCVMKNREQRRQGISRQVAMEIVRRMTAKVRIGPHRPFLTVWDGRIPGTSPKCIDFLDAIFTPKVEAYQLPDVVFEISRVRDTPSLLELHREDYNQLPTFFVAMKLHWGRPSTPLHKRTVYTQNGCLDSDMVLSLLLAGRPKDFSNDTIKAAFLLPNLDEGISDMVPIYCGCMPHNSMVVTFGALREHFDPNTSTFNILVNTDDT